MIEVYFRVSNQMFQYATTDNEQNWQQVQQPTYTPKENPPKWNLTESKKSNVGEKNR